MDGLTPQPPIPETPHDDGSNPLPDRKREDLAAMLAHARVNGIPHDPLALYEAVYGSTSSPRYRRTRVRVVFQLPSFKRRVAYLEAEMLETCLEAHVKYPEVVARIVDGLDAADQRGDPNWPARQRAQELVLKLLGKHPDKSVAVAGGKVTIFIPDNGRFDAD